LGAKLGCGAYLEELERTSIGNFNINQAQKISNLNWDNWQEFISAS
jgi:tRNA U55 pseudouridine synthase TruB